MGYDFYLHTVEKSCGECGHNRSGQLTECYVSYNHSWAFYKYLNHASGLRWIYEKPVTQIVSPLRNMINKFVEEECDNYVPTHDMDNLGTIAWSDKMISTDVFKDANGKWHQEHRAQDDGWATTMYNAYRSANEILDASMKAIQDGNYTAEWNGD